MSDDIQRTEYLYEFDPEHPDADPETGLRQWTRAELDARDERLNARPERALPKSLSVLGKEQQ